MLLNCQVGAKYKALACLLMAFEKKHYTAWLEPVEATIAAHLKQPLLREDPMTKKCASLYSMGMHVCTLHVYVYTPPSRQPMRSACPVTLLGALELRSSAATLSAVLVAATILCSCWRVRLAAA